MGNFYLVIWYGVTKIDSDFFTKATEIFKNPSKKQIP